MIKIIQIIILLVLNFNQVYALPNCTGDYYHNCFGTTVFPDGEKYIGEFKNNMRNGQGTNTWPNGHRYEGNWKDNKRHGLGVVTSLQNGFIYEGYYKDDKVTGLGVSKWSSGERYEGYWKDAKHYGQGFIIWPDGERYLGNWKDNKRHGQGVNIWPDGKKYVGEFSNDLLNGEGILTFPNGERREGLFSNDVLIKSQKVRNIEAEVTDRNNEVRKKLQQILEHKKYAEKEESRQQNEENRKQAEKEREKQQAEKERKKRQAEEKKQQALKALESKKITLAMGSGFWFNDLGYFATNYHVIDGCEKVQLIEGNNLIDSEIVTFDKINDLAIGKVNKKVKASFILSKNPELGEEVMVGGFPLSNILQNDSIKITRGIVSSLSGLNNNYSMLQIDAPIQQGNSGGPIINSYGEVIGVATSYLRSTKEFDTQNVNFGVKVNLIRNMSESLGIKVAKAKKQKEKNTKQLAKLLEKNTVHIHCTNTYKQWVVLQNNRESNASLSEHIKLNLKDYIN